MCVCETCLTNDGGIVDEMELCMLIAAVLGRNVAMGCVWPIIGWCVYKLNAVNVFLLY